MTLADVRKLSIKKQLRIHFRLQNGLECIVTEHGVAEIPELKTIPDFNLEQELVSAGQFLLEPAVIPDKKNAPKSRSVGRDEMVQMTASGPAAAAHDEHDDE
ncbi:MAG TPA: hypothetical protein VG456_03660 [Candidatus Sulfopaludibacter sp.]|jgi:hypothetical protein|nr:hypothetical protein [Candidatus Sulfopaludibacter sp.]